MPDNVTLYFESGSLWTRLHGSQNAILIMLQKSWRNTCAESRSRRRRLRPEENEQHEGRSMEELRDQQTYTGMGDEVGDALNGG